MAKATDKQDKQQSINRVYATLRDEGKKPSDALAETLAAAKALRIRAYKVAAQLAEQTYGTAKHVEQAATFVPSHYQQAVFDWIVQGRGNGIINAVAGSGKCVLPDTMVAVNGDLMRIEDIYTRYHTAEVFDGEGYFSVPCESLQADSFDESKGVWTRKPIEFIYRQKVQEQIRIVTLNDGNTIGLTKQHKLYDGFQWTNDLKVGDIVAVPSKLVSGQQPFDPELAEFFGWLIGEYYDTHRGNSAVYALTMRDQETIEHIKSLINVLETRYDLGHRENRITAHKDKNLYLMRFASKEMRQFLSTFDFQSDRRSNGKVIPQMLMNAEDTAVAAFLRALFDAEGSVNITKVMVEIVSASKILMQQVTYLLRRFGVWPRFARVCKGATNGRNIKRDYYRLLITSVSLRSFAQHIGFSIAYKQQALAVAIDRDTNPNKELLPSNKIIGNLMHDHCISRTVLNLPDETYDRKCMSRRTYHTRVRPALENIYVGRKIYGNQFRKTFVADTSLVSHVRHATAQLDHLSTQALQYAVITKIDDVDYEGFVYDLTVADTHNFLAEHILCHNTTSLVQAAHLIKTQRAIFLAFNKHIADELAERLIGTSMMAQTLHSVGYGILAKAFRGRLQVESSKYRNLAKVWCEREGAAFVRQAKDPKSFARELAYAMEKLADKVRVTLTDVHNVEAMTALCRTYDLLDDPIVWRGVGSILQAGKWQAESALIIDYTDMIWLPRELSLPIPQYDWVFVDEVQDLNAAQTYMVTRMLAPGGRMLACGDPRQSIFGFAGADSESFYNVKTALDAVEMPLSICYRCPTAVLTEAQKLVPTIEARPNAPQGIVESVPEHQLTTMVREGDLILCRLTAPLVSWCIKLIGQRIPARVRGRDVAKNLCELAQKIAGLCSWEWFLRGLDEYVVQQVTMLSKKEDSGDQITRIRDMADALQACYTAFQAPDVESLCRQIDGLFTDERASVWLSTVHRAKGLEANRVFILQPEKLPLRRKDQSLAQLQQEYNLRYVALTRAKESMYFLISPEQQAKHTEEDDSDESLPILMFAGVHTSN